MHDTPDDMETVGGDGGSGTAPRRWGPLEIRRELGRGGFGVVYRAWDPQLAREVALKVVSSALATDASATVDILGEARRLASVRHPNVVTVYGADRVDHSIGLWMELVEGCTLKQLVAERGTFGASEVVAAGIDICGAVAAVHNARLLHRDIKAENIMREQGGRIVLMDFGCGAGRADTGLTETLAGTPTYWAPELLEGGPATVGTDLYCIGVTLFYLLTRRYPVTGRTVEDVRRMHREARAERLHDARPDLPTSLVAVIERALEADPKRRYATAGEFRAALVATGEWQPTPAAAVAPPDDAPTIVLRRSTRSRWLVAGVAIVALLAASGAYVQYARGNRSTLNAGAAASTIETLVVLPFTNLTGDPNEAFLANAVAQELTTALAARRGINTIPWSYVVQLVQQRQDLSDVVARTRADGVIEGSVQLAPPTGGSSRRVRISSSLRHARSGGLIWSNTFEEELGKLLPATAIMADQVATRIGAALAVRRDAGPQRVPASVDSDTMELYLRGRDIAARFDSPERVREAIDFFGQAVARNDRFMPAYSALAMSYAFLSTPWNALDPQTAFDRIMEVTAKALAIDDSDPDVWAARAYAEYLFAWDWMRAAEDFGRAMALGTPSDGMRREYLLFLTAVGRHSEAIAQGEAVVAAFPTLASSHRSASWAYFFARQYDRAIEHSLAALRIDPDHVLATTLLARAYSAKGSHDEALATLRPLAESARGQRQWPHFAYVLAAAGQRDEAVTVLNKSLAAGADPYSSAAVYAALRMPDRAMALLERGYTQRDPSMVNLADDPRMDHLRSRQDFQALLRRMRYPQFALPSPTPPSTGAA